MPLQGITGAAPRGAARSVAAAGRAGTRRVRALPRHRHSGRRRAGRDAACRVEPSRLETLKVDDSAYAVRGRGSARRAGGRPRRTARIVGDQRDARQPNACRGMRCSRPRRRSALPAARGSRCTIDQLDGTIGQGIGRFRVVGDRPRRSARRARTSRRGCGTMLRSAGEPAQRGAGRRARGVLPRDDARS